MVLFSMVIKVWCATTQYVKFIIANYICLCFFSINKIESPPWPDTADITGTALFLGNQHLCYHSQGAANISVPHAVLGDGEIQDIAIDLPGDRRGFD